MSATRRLAGGALLAALALPTLLAAAPTAAPSRSAAAAPLLSGWLTEGDWRIGDADNRLGEVLPTAERQAMVDALGATRATWTRYGTPRLLINHGGVLSDPAPQLSAQQAATAWIRDNAAMLGLDAAAIDALEVLRVEALLEGPDRLRQLQGLEPLAVDVPHVVLLRQTFGGVSAGVDGLLDLGLTRDNEVAFVFSSLTGDSRLTNAVTLSPVEALTAAAVDAQMQIGTLSAIEPDGEFQQFASDRLADPQRARLRAVPTADNGVRLAWEATLLDTGHEVNGHPMAYQTFVDAQTGEVLVRWQQIEFYDGEHQVEGNSIEGAGHNGHAHDANADADATEGAERDPADVGPYWRVFPVSPNLPYLEGTDAFADLRETWCLQSDLGERDDAREARSGCDRELVGAASRLPWDMLNPGVPTFTTLGNNASTAISNISFLTPDTMAPRPVSPTREYDFPWTNAWNTSACDPTVFGDPTRNFGDQDAATAQLFASHNFMHDWAYLLGFTETTSNLQFNNFGITSPARANDGELGSSQAGRVIGQRDNANQITLQDGTPGITNQYLWQPLQGIFYVECVDGAYDFPIVAHEYGHAIQNRMTGGPDGDLTGFQARSMGESWADLEAIEIMNTYGPLPEGAPNAAAAAYATNNNVTGIREWAADSNPLTYGNVGYYSDSVHATAEIWTGTNWDIREAMIAKYDAQFPAADRDLQVECAEGRISSEACPGNRRWKQLIFDGYLLQLNDPSMLDARDGILAADLLRYDGANQDLLWEIFAKRGMGEFAETAGVADFNPIPDFTSPLHDEALVSFEVIDSEGDRPEDWNVYVGVLENDSTPLVGTDETIYNFDVAEMIPGTYDLLAVAPGFGGTRLTVEIPAGVDEVTVTIPLRDNLASINGGAEVVDGDGDRLEALVDDTESTNWESIEAAGTASEGKGEGAFVEGRQVTIDLAGDEPQLLTEVQVSAAQLPTLGQSRMTMLRSFDVQVCDATTADCDDDASWVTALESPEDAFPAARPRPLLPKMILRPFSFAEPVAATHARLVVRDSQCTGNPLYQRENTPDNDPTADPDCDTGNLPPLFEAVVAAINAALDGDLPDPTAVDHNFETVRAAEFQVFASAAPMATIAYGDTVVEVPTGGYVDGMPMYDRSQAHQG